RHAWEKSRHELEAKGFDLNWNNYIPPPVPDDQNFFKAPRMQEWFVGRNSNKGPVSPATNQNTWSFSTTTNSIVTEAQAREYLAWGDQFALNFEMVREALKRPYARMDGDYSQPEIVPIPNFVAVREIARFLRQRAHCYFLLRRPDKALEELTLIHDM